MWPILAVVLGYLGWKQYQKLKAGSWQIFSRFTASQLTNLLQPNSPGVVAGSVSGSSINPLGQQASQVQLVDGSGTTVYVGSAQLDSTIPGGTAFTGTVLSTSTPTSTAHPAGASVSYTAEMVSSVGMNDPQGSTKISWVTS